VIVSDRDSEQNRAWARFFFVFGFGIFGFGGLRHGGADCKQNKRPAMPAFVHLSPN